MVSGHVFKFYGLSGFTSLPPSTPVTTSAEIATQFEIFVPEDLAPEDSDGILSEEEVSAPVIEHHRLLPYPVQYY